MPLCVIFNLSMEFGVFPHEWKKSFITRLFKSCDRNNIENYRPISGLLIIAKVFESLVKSLSNSVNSYIIPEQHGFIVGKNTVTNLAIYSHDIVHFFFYVIDMYYIYTDFKKEFDKVNHLILLNKLNNFGIHGPLLKWFESYLVDRQQIVKINNYFSRPFFPPSGVPQGSHLGPFVFLIFINDILLNVKNSKALMFADDLKLYYTIHNLNDCLRLQDDLDLILNWCNINDM